MSEPEQATISTSRQQKILEHLEVRARTWSDLRSLTKINDDALGLIIGELLSLRKIWTIERNEVRVYGIERRTGLVPRFAHERRRADDLPI
jgi:hypothetical protein